MTSNNPIQLFQAITTLLLASMLAVASASPPPPPPPPAARDCSDEVVAFSPCLSYISSPPNNISFSPSSRCCAVFSSAFGAGDTDCLCFLVRRPLLLSFPLNSAKLLSLSSFCPLGNAGSKANGSLESLCSGSSGQPPPPLPPPQGVIGPGTSNQHDSGPGNPPSPLMSSPPDSVDTSPATPNSTSTAPNSTSTTPNSTTTTPNSSHIPAVLSSAAKQLVNNSGDWFPLGMVIPLVPIFADLYCYTHR